MDKIIWQTLDEFEHMIRTAVCPRLSAEKEGFEPPVPFGTTVFKTAAIDHSAISPIPIKDLSVLQKRRKVNIFLIQSNLILKKY